MSAKTNFTTEQRKELAEILQAFGIPLEAFDGLRPDSYEHALARHSLEQLELLYSALLQPGLSLKEIQELVPPFPGGPRDGEKPSLSTLSKIGERLRTSLMMLEVESTAKMMEAVQRKIKKELPTDSNLQENVLDELVTLIGQEAIQQTLLKRDAKTRNSNAKILLKRSDQKMAEKEYRRLVQTDIEKAMESFYEFIKPFPALVEAYQKFKSEVDKATSQK
jgi:hypothetical protein